MSDQRSPDNRTGDATSPEGVENAANENGTELSPEEQLRVAQEQEAAAEAERREEERRREEHEKALDFLAENMFLAASKVNEGNNGVILHLDVTLLSEQLVEFCKENGIDLGDSRAVKVMKLYRGGAGAEEYRLHQKAFQAVGSNADTVALVPRPVLYRDFELSASAQSKIKQVTGNSGERAEIIVMDYIEGQDLAEILFRTVLEHKRPDIPAADMVGWSVDRLAQEVALELGFEVPGGKARDEGARMREIEQVEEGNARKIYEYLSRQGFQLDPTIIDRLKTTFDRVHGAGMVHRDAHERNIMITGDPWVQPDSDGQRQNTVYVIDFGAAVEFEGRYDQNLVDLYRDGERRYYQDEKVLRKLKDLTKPPESARDRHVREDGERLMEKLTSKRRNPQFAKKRIAWLERHDSKKGEAHASIDGARAVEVLYGFHFNSDHDVMSDHKFEMFADYLVAIIEEGRATADDIKSALNTMANKATSLPARGRINELGRALEYVGRQVTESE